MDGEITETDLELAHELASLANTTALEYFRAGVSHELKGDGSPVSAADLAVEELLVDRLRKLRPDDGIVSEECGVLCEGRRRWVLDPIDGTVSFLAGDEAWGTHIAVEVDGEMQLGIITRPVLGLRWWAAIGHGAYRSSDPEVGSRQAPLRVSDQAELHGAAIGVYAEPGSPVPDLLEDAGSRVVREGSPMLEFLEGHLDAVVSHNCGLAWDHAPGIVLTAQAGGRFVDPAGGRRADLRGGLYTNGHLDAELIRALGQSLVR